MTLLSDVDRIAVDPAAFFTEVISVDFHAVNTWLGGAVGTVLSVQPFGNDLSILEQMNLCLERCMYLQGHTAFGWDFIAHDGGMFESPCLETESARGGREVVADETIPFGERFVDHFLIGRHIAAERLWNKNMGVDRSKVEFVWKYDAMQGSQVQEQGVRIGTAQRHDAVAIFHQSIPALDRFRDGRMPDELREERVKHSLELGAGDHFELAQAVPQFDAGVALHIPIHPGDIVLTEGGRFRVSGMGDEADAPRRGNTVDQRLRVVCQTGKVPVRVEHQQVVLLRDPILVVDFLSNQEQDSVRADAVVSFHALHQDVVIRHDDGIQSRFEGGVGDILVGAGAVRVACMHMQVDDDFVHRSFGSRELEIGWSPCLTVLLPSRYNVPA